MLSTLEIKNMAIIECVQLNLNEGFTVITGETGAGKSVLLGSLSLLKGETASDSLIREGFDNALVEATFTNLNLEIQGEHYNELTISRELIRGKTSVCRLNGFKTPLKTLKSLKTKLFHSVKQHENHSLTNQTYQRALIDYYGKEEINTLKEIYQSSYKAYRTTLDKITELDKTDQNQDQLVEFLTYQIEDIEKNEFTENEEEELKNQKKLIKSKKNIQSHVNASLTALGKINEELINAENAIQALSDNDDFVTPLIEKINNLQNEANDIQATIEIAEQKWKVPIIINIDEVESRLDTIFKYKNKYKAATLPQLLETLNNLKEKKNKITYHDQEKTKLTSEIKELKKYLDRHGHALFDQRKKTADKLSKHIEKELTKLNFQNPKINLKLEYTPEQSQNEGQDKITFLIAPNIGFSPLPLEKIASGGERSRILLVLQSILQNNKETGTLIFDEIDTGIGGMTAHTLAEKILDISKERQVITITHLPQIAEKAEHHFQIKKGIKNNITTTTIHLLDEQPLKEKEYLRMSGKS